MVHNTETRHNWKLSEIAPEDPTDPGSEYVNAEPKRELSEEARAKLAERMKEAHPHRFEKGKKNPGSLQVRQKKRLAKFRELVGKVLYMQTKDGWFCHVIVRDVKWLYGRVDLLVEQGERITWVSCKRCYLPPEWERKRYGKYPTRSAPTEDGGCAAEGEGPGGVPSPSPTENEGSDTTPPT